MAVVSVLSVNPFDTFTVMSSPIFTFGLLLQFERKRSGIEQRSDAGYFHSAAPHRIAGNADACVGVGGGE